MTDYLDERCCSIVQAGQGRAGQVIAGQVVAGVSLPISIAIFTTVPILLGLWLTLDVSLIQGATVLGEC